MVRRRQPSARADHRLAALAGLLSATASPVDGIEPWPSDLDADRLVQALTEGHNLDEAGLTIVASWTEALLGDDPEAERAALTAIGRSGLLDRHVGLSGPAITTDALQRLDAAA